MDPAEYAAALRAATRAHAPYGADTMAALRLRHPDLAAKADAQAWTTYRENLRKLVAAELAVRAATEAAKAAADDPSPMRRSRAVEALTAAEAEHDNLLRAVESAHATLPLEGNHD